MSMGRLGSVLSTSINPSVGGAAWKRAPGCFVLAVIVHLQDRDDTLVVDKARQGLYPVVARILGWLGTGRDVPRA